MGRFPARGSGSTDRCRGRRRGFGGGGGIEVCFALVLTTVLEPYRHDFGLPVFGDGTNEPETGADKRVIERKKKIVQVELSGECFTFVARWVGGVVEELLEHGELRAGETLAGALGGGVGRLEEEGVIGGGEAR